MCCKIMEKIIKKAFMQFFGQHYLVSYTQDGVRSGRSRLKNLRFTLERWTQARDASNVVHAIYIHLKKTFDGVHYQRLFHKLRNAGICGRLLVWIQSLLAGRCQSVQVGRQQSSEVIVVIGVPQGSVLGPKLFLVFINDCVKDLDCDIILFADDKKLWKVIHNATDADHLQANLNRLEDWSKRWLIPFNIGGLRPISSVDCATADDVVTGKSQTLGRYDAHFLVSSTTCRQYARRLSTGLLRWTPTTKSII
nr:unnamed protein product [Spirometra erinaceieuropaei]